MLAVEKVKSRYFREIFLRNDCFTSVLYNFVFTIQTFRVLVHCGDTATGCIIIQLCSLYNVNITTSCVSQAANKMIDAGVHKIIFLDQVSPDLPSYKRLDFFF